MMKTLTSHPYADLFPMIEGEARASFTANVKASGVLAPIVLLDGQILDGRNRYRAAQELGVDCPMVEFTGTDPLGFVIAANLERRHLSTAQRAAIAAEMATMRLGSNPGKGHVVAEGPSVDGPCPALSIAQAARAMGVSTASVESAKARKRTDPVSHERVKTGEKIVGKTCTTAMDKPVKQPVDPKVHEGVPVGVAAETCPTPDEVEKESMTAILTKEDFRFLLGLLHPAGAPKGRKGKYERAYSIVRKLDRYVQAGKG